MKLLKNKEAGYSVIDAVLKNLFLSFFILGMLALKSHNEKINIIYKKEESNIINIDNSNILNNLNHLKEEKKEGKCSDFNIKDNSLYYNKKQIVILKEIFE